MFVNARSLGQSIWTSTEQDLVLGWASHQTPFLVSQANVICTKADLSTFSVVHGL